MVVFDAQAAGPAGAIVDAPGAGGPEFEGVCPKVVAAPVWWAGDGDLFAVHEIGGINIEFVDDVGDFFEECFAGFNWLGLIRDP